MGHSSGKRRIDRSAVPGLLAVFVVVVEAVLSSITVLYASNGYDLAGKAQRLAVDWAWLVGLTGLAFLVFGVRWFALGWNREEPMDGAVLMVLAGVGGLILVPVIASGDIRALSGYVLFYVSLFGSI